jgi:hypothetical protein
MNAIGRKTPQVFNKVIKILCNVYLKKGIFVEVSDSHLQTVLQFNSKVIAQYFPKFRMVICEQNCFGPRKNKKANQPTNIS